MCASDCKRDAAHAARHLHHPPHARAHGQVSFLMDRQKPGVTKSQPGFIDFVVRPLFETWVSCFPESNVLLDRINQNYAVWQVLSSPSHPLPMRAAAGTPEHPRHGSLPPPAAPCSLDA
jgi:hypothetical protein